MENKFNLESEFQTGLLLLRVCGCPFRLAPFVTVLRFFFHETESPSFRLYVFITVAVSSSVRQFHSSSAVHPAFYVRQSVSHDVGPGAPNGQLALSVEATSNLSNISPCIFYFQFPFLFRYNHRKKALVSKYTYQELRKSTIDIHVSYFSSFATLLTT